MILLSIGLLNLVFDNVAGNQDLRLNSPSRNASGESFTPITFNYFVSNVKLTRTDGREYVVLQDSRHVGQQPLRPLCLQRNRG